MKIVFVSSEVEPFAKTGGLADVAGSLPKALQKAGHDVFVFMPRYKLLERKAFGVKPLTRRIRLRIGKGTKEFNIYSSTLPKSQVPVYLIDKELYFCRKDLYHENGIEFPDNAERFHYFCLTVLESLKILDIKADIIHCNDWPAAVIPMYLKTLLKDDPFYQNMKTVYTIHNLAYQGVFDAETLQELGMSGETFPFDHFEFWGKANFTKSAVIHSDQVTTVSPTYSKEIQTPEYGCGLEGILQNASNKISGITNGLDYDTWNPETDRNLFANYSVSTIAKKSDNKKALLQTLNMPYSEKTPVIGMVSRMVEHKGFDLVIDSMESLVKQNLQFIILANGDPQLEQKLSNLASKFPDQIRVCLKYDPQLAARIYAGADMLLMPSRFEPCGLSQLIGLRYGTLPIVRNTGGLADTIIDVNQDKQHGNGFVFQEYSVSAMNDAINRAVSEFKTTEQWNKIRTRAMQIDVSWTKSAEEYCTMYERVLNYTLA